MHGFGLSDAAQQHFWVYTVVTPPSQKTQQLVQFTLILSVLRMLYLVKLPSEIVYTVRQNEKIFLCRHFSPVGE